MAQKPIRMEQLKQILQLHNQGISIREIARRTGVSRNSVKKYIQPFDERNLCITSDTITLAEIAYPNNEELIHQKLRLEQLQDYIKINLSELNKTGVTRGVLWKEYLQLYPDGYGYSQFCYHLASSLKQKDVAMHLEYEPGDLMMIDFAGKKLHYTDMETGEVIPCEVFVAILPFSGLIFCLAVASQKTADFVICINAMLLYFTGTSRTILGDNMRTIVTRVDRYEPEFTEICYQLSEHYQTTFSATRPYSPRDKAMVEGAVKIGYTHIYAPLRNQVFSSITALNKSIREQLDLLNHKDYKKSGCSRFDYFDREEKSLLQPLPPHRFSFKRVAILTVQRNYHVQLSETKKYYSVPYQYTGKKVKVLYDDKTVEIYDQAERIAFHTHRFYKEVYHTALEHMPPHHQKMKEIKGWTKEDLLRQARRLGEPVVKAAELILTSNSYEVQNYKSCHGMLMLAKKYSTERLRNACSRALLGTRVNYTMIKNILKNGLDKQASLFDNPVSSIPQHENIRGKEHYQ